jgi:restriction system protein
LVIQVAVVGFTALGEYQHLVRGITTPWVEILKGLEQDPDFLHKIHPRKLEELVADAYKEQGYKDVILTPYSGDKGRDVIVSATLPGIGTIKIVDQVKRYDPRRKVTANDVRALAGVVSLDQAVSKGIVTTTSDFAPGIQTEFATLMPSRIELKNGVALKQWLSEVYRSGTA